MIRARAMAVFLLGMGTLHFLVPKFFDMLIPPQLPGSPRAYTLGSGVAEIAVGALLVRPRTQRLGGRLAALLFVAVFPGNVQMAYDWVRSEKPFVLKIAALLRLPMQVPMVTEALKVARTPVTPG